MTRLTVHESPVNRDKARIVAIINQSFIPPNKPRINLKSNHDRIYAWANITVHKVIPLRLNNLTNRQYVIGLSIGVWRSKPLAT
jgi:hypothetical protein